MRISDWSSDVCSSDLQSSSPSSRTTRLQLLAFELIWRLCYERLQMVSSPTCQTPAQVTCAHCQRSWEAASAPSSVAPRLSSKRAAHDSAVFAFVNTFW